MSAWTFGSGLVLSEGAPEPLRRLQVRFAKHLGRELFRLDVSLLGGDQRRSAGDLRAHFEGLSRRSRSTAYAVLLRPELHVHLLCAARAAGDGRWEAAVDHQRALWPQLAFELRLEQKGPRSQWSWPPPARSGVMGCPRRRVPDGLFHPVAGAMVLALHDDNPLSMSEAHPDKQGNAMTLGDATVATWIESLRAGLESIQTHLPGLRQEMDRVIHQFVPVGTYREAHLSASYAESVGTIYLSLHPSQMTMTEAIIHEHQHNKLNMLLALDPVMHNAYQPLYASPIRPDPRPLSGVLLAAHAFIVVAEYYRRVRDPRLDGRFAAIVANNDAALDTLTASAEPTPAGQAVIAELARLHAQHREALVETASVETRRGDGA